MLPDTRPSVRCVVYGGDDYELTLLVRDQSERPVDLSGCSVELRLYAVTPARQPSGSALIAKATGGGGIAVADAAAGKLVVELGSAETEALADGAYYVVARLTNAFGRKGTIEPFLARVVQTPLT